MINSIQQRTQAHIQHALEPMQQFYTFKPEFLARYEQLLGKEQLQQFLTYSTTFPQRAIRVNTLKISVEELINRTDECWELQQVPWCKEAFWIRHKQGR